MRRLLLWVLVVWPIAVLDLWYAWVNEATFDQWEMNPIGVWVHQRWGMGGLAATKITACLVYTAVGWWTRSRLMFWFAVGLGIVVGLSLIGGLI